jgi:hypothetical protein
MKHIMTGIDIVSREELPRNSGYIVVPNWATIALIAGLLGQFFWVAWYFSKQDSKTEQLARDQAQIIMRIDRIDIERDRISVLETKFENLTNLLLRLEAQITRVAQGIERGNGGVPQ